MKWYWFGYLSKWKKFKKFEKILVFFLKKAVFLLFLFSSYNGIYNLNNLKSCQCIKKVKIELKWKKKILNFFCAELHSKQNFKAELVNSSTLENDINFIWFWLGLRFDLGICASGHPGIWASGYPGIRASGRLGIWAYWPLGIRVSGHLDVLASGHPGILTAGHHELHRKPKQKQKTLNCPTENISNFFEHPRQVVS